MVKRGLILAVILSLFCIQITQATNVSYKYDSLNRLVEVLYENTGKIEYTYDPAGNRLSQKVTKLNSTISVSPTNRDVTKEASTTTFNVSNTGTGTISWTAAVTTGSSWLSITSGASGSNSGTITCSYSANTTTSSRIATIRISVSGATGSSVDVTVTQAGSTQPAGCSEEKVVLTYNYLGGCGYTQSTSFTLAEESYITRIRIWYDTSVGGNTLSATLSGPNGYSSASGIISKNGCQGNWCEAMWNLNQELKAGNYTLTADSKSVCSNPSGQTTLILYGCNIQSPSPTPGMYFKEVFSGTSSNTWTSSNGNWYVNNGKLNVEQITSGKMAHYQTSFRPNDFFVIDTDVELVSIADGGAYGIYPFTSGAARFEVNGKQLQGVGTIILSSGNAYLFGWDSLGGNWYTFAKYVTTPPVTSIGVEYSYNKISLRINKQNTTFFSGSFGAAPSVIDSLWLIAQGDSTHVHFDNIYADPIMFMTAECMANLDENFLLHIPYLSYGNGTLSLWADFVYAFNPTYSMLIPFKLANADFISNPSFSCTASTLSDDLKIHIPDLLLPDGITHLWVDLEYSQTLSTDGNFYWVVTNVGINETF